MHPFTTPSHMEAVVHNTELSQLSMLAYQAAARYPVAIHRLRQTHNSS
jgi:hypothetical protein